MDDKILVNAYSKFLKWFKLMTMEKKTQTQINEFVNFKWVYLEHKESNRKTDTGKKDYARKPRHKDDYHTIHYTEGKHVPVTHYSPLEGYYPL